MALIAVAECARLADYRESIRQAGGTIVEVRAGHDNPEAILARVDGVLLTGGGDVDPAFYDEAPHPSFEPAEPGRDAFEMALVRAAVDSRRPLLAICRGMQVLNVALGGSLIQDIPSNVPGALPHSVAPPKDVVAHDVIVDPGSRLFALLADRIDAGDRCPVNSRHHQAIHRPAAGLRVTATAPDGVIEAVEHVDAAFCVAVQWHPENFVASRGFAALFAGFVASAASGTTR